MQPGFMGLESLMELWGRSGHMEDDHRWVGLGNRVGLGGIKSSG